MKKTKTLIQKYTCTPIFTTVLFIIAKIWEQPEYPSTDEWIRRFGLYIGQNTTQP